MKSIYSYVLYKITSPSGKFYIGVTNNFNRRKSEHLSDWKNRPEKIALHHSFSKYGFDNHTFEVLMTGLTKEKAYNLENKVINSLGSTNSRIGLNSREGGKGGNCIDWNSENGKMIIQKANKTKEIKYLNSWAKKAEIIENLKHTHTIEDFCKMFNCSSTSICNYLKKTGIKIPRKHKHDLNKIADEIKKYYLDGKTNDFVIKETGYSKGTICRAKNILMSKQIE